MEHCLAVSSLVLLPCFLILSCRLVLNASPFGEADGNSPWAISLAPSPRRHIQVESCPSADGGEASFSLLSCATPCTPWHVAWLPLLCTGLSPYPQNTSVRMRRNDPPMAPSDRQKSREPWAGRRLSEAAGGTRRHMALISSLSWVISGADGFFAP